MLETALEEVNDGNIDPRVATAMASLAGAIVRVFQASEMEESQKPGSKDRARGMSLENRIKRLEGRSTRPGHMGELLDKAFAHLDEAEGAGRVREARAAVQSARETLVSMERVSSEWEKERELKFVRSQEWINLRSLVVRALAPFPEAKAAVVEALKDDEAQGSRVLEG